MLLLHSATGEGHLRSMNNYFCNYLLSDFSLSTVRFLCGAGQAVSEGTSLVEVEL